MLLAVQGFKNPILVAESFDRIPGNVLMFFAHDIYLLCDGPAAYCHKPSVFYFTNFLEYLNDSQLTWSIKCLRSFVRTRAT